MWICDCMGGQHSLTPALFNSQLYTASMEDEMLQGTPVFSGRQLSAPNL